MRLMKKMAASISVSLMGLLYLNPSLAETPRIEAKAENTLQDMLNYLKNKSS